MLVAANHSTPHFRCVAVDTIDWNDSGTSQPGFRGFLRRRHSSGIFGEFEFEMATDSPRRHSKKAKQSPSTLVVVLFLSSSPSHKKLCQYHLLLVVVPQLRVELVVATVQYVDPSLP